MKTPKEDIKPDSDRLYEPFPVTGIQRAYLIGRTTYFELGGIGSHVYFEFQLLDLNITRFNQAWNHLIERHPTLRTIFSNEGEQRVLPFNELPMFTVEVIDLSKKSEKKSHAEFLDYRNKMKHQKLDATMWPLFYCKAFKFKKNEYTICVYLDLLISDARSRHILLKELFYYYNNPKGNLPLIKFTYRDCMIKLDSLRKSHTYEKQKKYWLARLENMPDAPQLPTNKENIKQHPGFNRLTLIIKKEKWDYLKKIIASHDVSQAAALCTVFSKVLSFWSKEPIFTITMMYTNRKIFHRHEVSNIVGNFSSTLLLSIDMHKRNNFIDEVKAIYSQLSLDLENGLFSGIDFLHEVNKQRENNTKPSIPVVFNCMLNINKTYANQENIHSNHNDTPNINHFYMETPHVELDTQVREDEEGNLICHWDYIKSCFPNKMIEKMFEIYSLFLTKLTDDSGYWTRHIHLSRLMPVDYFHSINKSNQTYMLISDGLLYSEFIDQVRKHPKHTAIITTKMKISYIELYQKSIAIATRIKNKHAGKHIRIAIIMQKGWEQIVAVLGVLFSENIYIPIDPAFPPDRIKSILNSGDVDIVLTQDHLVSDLHYLHNVKLICVNNKIRSKKNCAFDLLPKLTKPDHLAYIIYTSGSTGIPKGVMISHESARNTIIDINRRYSIGRNDKIFGLSALSFDLSVYDIFGTLSAGASIVIPDANRDKDPAHWAELVKQHQVTVWNSVPALMQMLVIYTRKQAHHILRSIKLVMLSGDKIPVNLPSQVKRLCPTGKIISLGGATEASIWSILHPIKSKDANRTSIPYGKAMANQTVYVLDHSLEIRPPWVIGEIYIGGIGLASGYFNNPEKTTKSFICHPITGERLYKTGDLGYYEPDGNIIFVGRTDFQIKVLGHRIELEEIEAVLSSYPGIKESVVTYHSHSKMLVAYVTSDNNDISIDKLNEFLKSKLPTYMNPSKIIRLESLPLTSNGKIDRKELPKPDNIIDIKQTENIPPRSDVEKRICDIWTKHLGIDEIGIRDNFFDLGGDSFKAVLVIADIQETFNKDINISKLLSREDNIESLSKIIEGDNETDHPFRFLVKLKDGENGKPLFFIHPIGGSVICYRTLASKLPSQYTLYGLQSMDFKKKTPISIEEMARLYLNEIQQINKNGPYYFIGWSMGGVIAYEMAYQLIQQGKVVKWVAMLDSPLPNKIKLSLNDLITWFFTDLLRNSEVKDCSNMIEKILGSIKSIDKIGIVSKRLRELKLLPEALNDKRINELFRLFKTNYDALHIYQPQPVSMKLIQCKASETSNNKYFKHPFVNDASWGWNSVVKASADNYLIKGDHYSIISQPGNILKIVKRYLASGE